MARMCLCSKVLQNAELMEAMRQTADIGYRAVELFAIKNHLMADDPEAKTRELKKLIADMGIEIASMCTYIGNFDTKSDDECVVQLDRFKAHLEQANILDAGLLRVNPTYFGYERTATADEKARFAEWARTCADLAANSGKGICLENNLNMIATLAGTVEVLGLIDRPNAFVSYDPGNIIRADRENYGRMAVETLGERIGILQVKQIDMTLENLEDPACFVFYDEGHVDYSEIFEAAAKVPTIGYISVECHKLPTQGMTEKDVAAREYRLVREHAAQYFTDLE